MVLLILESLGSTELLFILVMALVFFGPRKLPQISRSLGKNMAHFRRASEDFKRTWEKEVSIEESSVVEPNSAMLPAAAQNSIFGGSETDQAGGPPPQPTIQAIAPDRVVARHSLWPDAEEAADNNNASAAAVESEVQTDGATDKIQPLPKREWL